MTLSLWDACAFYSWNQDNSLWRHLVNVFLRTLMRFLPPKKDNSVRPILLTFERNIRNFHNCLLERGYPAAILRKYLSEVKFADRKTALQQRNKSARKKLLPFVTQYHPALPSLKKILMGKWHLIQNQQQLREIFKEPPLISCDRKGKFLKDLLVRAKHWRSYYFQYDLVQESCDARCLCLTKILQHHQIQSSKGAREENGCSFTAIL